jgi:predicted RNA methylase
MQSINSLMDFKKIISELQIDAGVYRPNDSSIEMTKAALTCGNKFLEIGTGSGFTALILYLNGHEGIATDISPKSIESARKNFTKFKINAEPVESDLFDKVNGRFDSIIFNPPTNKEEGEKARYTKNYLKKIIPSFILKIITAVYQSAHSKKRREYLLSFIDNSKMHLNEGGTVLINIINSDVQFFKNELVNYDTGIYSSNDESSVFLIKLKHE